MMDDASRSPACKLCGIPAQPYSERNGFKIVRCPKCGFRFAVIPDGFDLDAIYDDEAFWNGGTTYGYRPNYDEALKETAPVFQQRIARINRLKRPGRMLEVGCAGGYVLKLAKESGWTVTGIEMSATMRRRAAALVDGPIFRSLDEVREKGSRFDCVVMFDVIEHVADPAGMLRAFGEIMECGALLAISTPNFDGHGAETGAPVSVWVEPPAHISYFGPKTLELCLSQSGFKTLEIERRLNPEMPLPAPVARLLERFRRGKRLRPRGVLGRIIKAYQLRRCDALYWLDYLVVYARQTR